AGGFGLFAEIVDAGDALVGMGIVPGGEIQANLGAEHRGPVVLAVPDDLAAGGGRFIIGVEPVAHVLAVDDGNALAAAVAVADHVLADDRAVLDVARVSRL